MSLSMSAFCDSVEKNNVYENNYLHAYLFSLKIKM